MKNHDKIATRLDIILTKLNASERFTVEDLVEEFGEKGVIILGKTIPFLVERLEALVILFQQISLEM